MSQRYIDIKHDDYLIMRNTQQRYQAIKDKIEELLQQEFDNQEVMQVLNQLKTMV